MKTKDEVLKIINECYDVDYVLNGEDEIGVSFLDKDRLADKILSSLQSYAKEQALLFYEYIESVPTSEMDTLYDDFIVNQNQK
jgi:hypothetical protein